MLNIYNTTMSIHHKFRNREDHLKNFLFTLSIALFTLFFSLMVLESSKCSYITELDEIP
jgi:uncharacterized membrane protein (DUF485 family)